MSKSFVKFRGAGFWSPDGVLEDWLFALLDIMDSNPMPNEWQKQLRDKWRNEATAGGAGCISAGLDEFLKTEGRIQFAVDLSQMALASVEFRDVRRIGELFISLLEGKLQTTASSPIDYWDRTQDANDKATPRVRRSTLLPKKIDPIAFVYRRLVQDHVADPFNEREILQWMLLLQSHRIQIVKPILDGYEHPMLLLPTTQRIAAEVAGLLWIYLEDELRRDSRYWYWQYTSKYEAKSEIPPHEVPEIEKLRERLESDERVKSVDLERN